MYHYRTNLFIISSILAFLWLAPFGAGQTAKAKDTVTAKIESRRIVDVCGVTKDQVVVVIDIGKVVRSDSLFGFNFQLTYDSTKIKFHSALYLNTISEFFEFKQVGFFRNGQIVGAVATMGSVPAAGDRPLIGFLGDYIGKCEDLAHIVFDYLEFTDEFDKHLIFENGFVEALVADKPERYFKIYTETDSSFIDTAGSEVSFKIKAELGIDSDINSLELKLFTDNFDNYYINSVESADNDLLEIDELTITDDSVDVSFFVKGNLNNKDVAIINIAEKRKGEEVAEISINPIRLNNDCSCFSRLISDKHYIKSDERDTTTTVVEKWESIKINEQYSEISNLWVIEVKDGAYSVSIYDMLGNLKLERQGLYGISRISLDRFSNGVYFGIIQDSDNKTIRKILTKTNY